MNSDTLINGRDSFDGSDDGDIFISGSFISDSFDGDGDDDGDIFVSDILVGGSFVNVGA